MAPPCDSVAIKLFSLSCSVVGWFWNTFTFIPWYVLSGNFKKPRYGQIQGKSKTGQPEGPYFDVNYLSGIEDGFQGICTLDQLFKYKHTVLNFFRYDSYMNIGCFVCVMF